MERVKKNKRKIIILLSILMIILCYNLSINLIQKYKDDNCNYCDSITADKSIKIKYFTIKNTSIPKFIQKRGSLINSGYLIFEKSENYFSKKVINTYVLKLNVNLKDTIEIFDGNKKYLIFDFKRKFVEPKYNMGSDKSDYYYSINHPCENYGFTVLANNKSKFIFINDINSLFSFKEKDFY